MVSEPWFEGFGHTLRCVWNQTKELVYKFSKWKDNFVKRVLRKKTVLEKQKEFIKKIIPKREKGCGACNQSSSSKYPKILIQVYELIIS